jgi:glycosyltransferase involved in cell wall biosynthesis
LIVDPKAKTQNHTPRFTHNDGIQMTVSVVIPTYNAAATIEATLDSVLQQTVAPDEILVLVDGSTDDTISLLRRYGGRVRVFEEPHEGLAVALNLLYARARGDLIAFLDSDDLWHPRYLEVQVDLAEKHPNACAQFTGHLNFHGFGAYKWDEFTNCGRAVAEVMDPATFLKRYHQATGPFASMSYCCIPRDVLADIGPKPFGLAGVHNCGVEDLYVFSMLCLNGRPIVYTQTPVVAYRITAKGHSADLLKMLRSGVDAFQLLDEHFRRRADPKLYRAFRDAWASKQRGYAKMLMGAGRKTEARGQLRNSLKNDSGASSIAKSVGLWFLTSMPAALQPKWPEPRRQ